MKVLAIAIAISKRFPGTAAAAAQKAAQEAKESADRAEALSQGVYMGADGKFYVNVQDD